LTRAVSPLDHSGTSKQARHSNKRAAMYPQILQTCDEETAV
jgi:hypothetical protein